VLTIWLSTYERRSAARSTLSAGSVQHRRLRQAGEESGSASVSFERSDFPKYVCAAASRRTLVPVIDLIEVELEDLLL